MSNMPQVTCIYKITSPSGKIYIGQAINARRRYLDYKSKLARSQPGLNNSIKKYGWDKHIFEIIHHLPTDVTQEVLNAYECLYMYVYKSCGIKLLNVKEGGSNGRNSDESIKKANEKWKIWFSNNPEGIKKAVEKSVLARKGKSLSVDHVEKIRECMKGRVFSESHKLNHSKSLKGKRKTLTEKFMLAQREKLKDIAGANRIAIVQYSLNGNFIKEWTSATEAADNYKVSRKGIEKCMKKMKGGKTFAGFVWRYKHDNTPIDLESLRHNRSPKPKGIVQYSIDGVFITDWESLTSASKELDINITNISSCVRGKTKTAGGHIWKYK